MFLINTTTIELEYFIGEKIPRYSILSHRWRDEEVDYQTFKGPGRGHGFRGYGKIAALCDLSRKRGIEYAWCDTCCIDKSSSAELTESINSMFRWYEKAEVCFAFLDDVNSINRYATLSESTWMKRGWTLQELLAPRRVEFYASDWTYIGTRHDLASDISSATGIASDYLLDNSSKQSRQKLLLQASMGERMSWAARRETTRKEDEAYCLLGLFGVNMPLLYGEGGDAFLRLQEEALRHSFDATLLAWAPLSDDGSSLAPRKERDPSKLIATSRYIFGITNPWSGSWGEDSTIFANLSLGFLAPNAKVFSHCNGLVSSRAAELDWDMTPQGLQIPLPVSGKMFPEAHKQPYVLLPCFLRHDPDLLLAIPVIVIGNGKFLKGARQGVFVSFHKWHQWPRTSIMLDMRGFSTPLHVERPVLEKIHCDVYIRSLPEGFVVKDLPGNIDNNNFDGSLRADHAWKKSGVVDVRADNLRLDLHFTIAHSRPGSGLRVRLGRCAYFLRPVHSWLPRFAIWLRAESDRVHSMAGITTTNDELLLEESNPRFLEVQRPWPDIVETLNNVLVSVRLTEMMIADRPVLFVDINYGPSRLGHLVKIFRHNLRLANGYGSAFRLTLAAVYPSLCQVILGVIVDIIVWIYDTLRLLFHTQLLLVAIITTSAFGISDTSPTAWALTLLHGISTCLQSLRLLTTRFSTVVMLAVYGSSLYSLWRTFEERIQTIFTSSPMLEDLMLSWKSVWNTSLTLPDLLPVIIFVSLYYLLPVVSIIAPPATPLIRRHWFVIALLETTLLLRWCRGFCMSTVTFWVLVVFVAKSAFISTKSPRF